MKNILFVYYTFEGNTQFVAETAASAKPMDTQRLLPDSEPPKKGPGKFLKGGGSALKKETPALKKLVHDVSKYEKIIIAYPIWAGTYPPAIVSFLKDNPLNDKKIYLIACSASGNAKKSFKQMTAALGGSEIIGTLSLKEPKKDKENAAEQIREFVKNI